MILECVFGFPTGGYVEGVFRLKITVLEPRHSFFENIKKSHRWQQKTWYMSLIFSKSNAANNWIKKAGLHNDSRTDLTLHVFKNILISWDNPQPQGPSLASRKCKTLKFFKIFIFFLLSFCADLLCFACILVLHSNTYLLVQCYNVPCCGGKIVFLLEI
jgi:hypothetical protein